MHRNASHQILLSCSAPSLEHRRCNDREGLGCHVGNLNTGVDESSVMLCVRICIAKALEDSAARKWEEGIFLGGKSSWESRSRQDLT